MRHLIPMLLLTANAMALETAEVVGMWKGASVTLEGTTTEYFFSQNGTMEMRAGGESEGLTFNLQAFSLWNVDGGTLNGKLTGGWTSVLGSTQAIPPDTGFNSSEIEIVAGSPRKMVFSGCDDEEFCTTDTLAYVGSSKSFTLPSLGSASIKRFAGKVDMRKSASGRLSMRVIHENRSYDLQGRAGQALLRP